MLVCRIPEAETMIARDATALGLLVTAMLISKRLIATLRCDMCSAEQANMAKDVPFQILVQPADLTPPQNWTANWLPAPPGAGDYSFILRWYVPQLGMTNGTYTYPNVETVDAIQ